MSEAGSDGHRERRTLMRGATAIAAILLFGRGIPRLTAAVRDRLSAARQVLTEEARAEADLRVSPRALDSARARQLRLGDTFPSLLRGRGPAEATAALIDVVNDIAQDSQVMVTTVSGAPDPTRKSSYLPVQVRAEVVGDVRGIASFAAMLEASDTRMRIVAMTIDQTEPGAATGQREELRGSFVIEALGRRPASPQLRAAATGDAYVARVGR